jgi:membrane fusion protein, multidrug efflux system
MTKRIIIVVIALFILFGLIFGFHAFRSLMIGKYVKQMMQEPVTISTVKAKSQNWHPTLSAVGNLTAVNGVDVNSQVPGQVVKITFESGQNVKKGDLLVQLDDSLDQQNLKTQQAQLSFSEEDYQRKKTLAHQKVIAQTDLDQAYRTLVQAQAAVASAQLNIDYKKIRAPFDGRLGISQVNLGEYISPGQALVPIQQLDPLYVDFSLPEQQLKLLYKDQPVALTIEAFPNEVFTGKISALNAKSDPNTHTISVRAIVPNPKTELYPGIYAAIHIILPARQAVITLPQTAIAYSLHGDSVFVVVKGKDPAGKPALIAEQRFVTVGERRGSVAAILSGVKEGEEVVSAGQLKLQPGTVVKVDNSIELK